jgi:hypothetical protein
MRALLRHSGTYHQAKDDLALAEEVREHLLREHPGLKPTDEQLWDTVHRRAYSSLEVYDPQYTGVLCINYFL